MKISKNNYSPNDRFLIKIFIQIISLDSSQRVPPMSPCPPLIITTVCPWLINHLSDPWDFNKSNGILLRSIWFKPYPKFYGSELLIIKGWSRKLARRSDWPTWGGLINPMLPLIMFSSEPGLARLEKEKNMFTAPVEVRRFQRFWKWTIAALFSSSCEMP